MIGPFLNCHLWWQKIQNYLEKGHTHWRNKQIMKFRKNNINNFWIKSINSLHKKKKKRKTKLLKNFIYRMCLNKSLSAKNGNQKMLLQLVKSRSSGFHCLCCSFIFPCSKLFQSFINHLQQMCCKLREKKYSNKKNNKHSIYSPWIFWNGFVLKKSQI